ncbi:hypothetical protein G6F68_018141 [Rhizopus microsporus]|nr:hypothetical protein G6F68_018141 [Rhizopus microsporus]
MDELVVARRVGEQVHLRLRNGRPLRHADFLRHLVGEGLRAGRGLNKVCGHGQQRNGEKRARRGPPHGRIRTRKHTE